MSEDLSVEEEERAKKAISVFFKNARQAKVATQNDAANIAKITLGQLKQYEAGNVMPRLTTARKLCEFYEVSWEDLGKLIENILKNKESEKLREPLFKNRINSSVVRTRGLHIVMEYLLKNG